MSDRPLSAPALPSADLSRCADPVPKIFTPEDIPRWLDSEAYHLVYTLITRLNIAVHSKTVQEPCSESKVILHLFLHFLIHADVAILSLYSRSYAISIA